MRSATTIRTVLQATFGIALLGGVAAALFWAVMSFNDNNDPNHPILTGTSIPAPTADDPQPAQPTPPPTAALPTREVALALPTAADLPVSDPTEAPPTEISIQEPQPAPTAAGPTPTPRVLQAPPPQPTATLAASDGIAAEVIPTPSGDAVEAARAFPTPAPLVDAAPPTSTPDVEAVVEATEPPRRDRDRPSPTPDDRRSTVVPAIVPLRDGTTRDVVVPGIPTFTVPAIEPAQGVPTITAVDPKPRKTKTGRGRDDGPGSVFPNDAIGARGGRTPGAKGAHRGIPGMFHPGRAANSPGRDKNDHANGNGNANGHDKNKDKDKDKGKNKKPGH